MIFAEIDAAGWLLIGTGVVAAVGSIVIQVVRLVIDYFDRRDKRRLEAESFRREEKRDAKIDVIADRANGFINTVAEASRVAGEATGELRAHKEAAASAAGLVVAAATVAAKEVLDKNA